MSSLSSVLYWHGMICRFKRMIAVMEGYDFEKDSRFSKGSLELPAYRRSMLKMMKLLCDRPIHNSEDDAAENISIPDDVMYSIAYFHLMCYSVIQNQERMKWIAQEHLVYYLTSIDYLDEAAKTALVQQVNNDLDEIIGDTHRYAISEKKSFSAIYVVIGASIMFNPGQEDVEEEKEIIEIE